MFGWPSLHTSFTAPRSRYFHIHHFLEEVQRLEAPPTARCNMNALPDDVKSQLARFQVSPNLIFQENEAFSETHMRSPAPFPLHRPT